MFFTAETNNLYLIVYQSYSDTHKCKDTTYIEPATISSHMNQSKYDELCEIMIFFTFSVDFSYF